MFLKRLRPSDSLSTGEIRRGLTMLLLDGVCTQSMLVLTGGAFLVAFALLLGASHKLIGVIAAMGPLGQILQIPGIYIVERLGLRKALVVSSATASRVFLLVMAAVPWFLREEHRLPVFVAALFLFFGVGAVGGAAFTPWMRDLVPHRILGRYFGRRLAVAISVGAAASIVAGRLVDMFVAHHPPGIAAYSMLFVVGALVGFVGVGFLSGIPEPRMSPPPSRSVFAVVAEPFRDARFRKLIAFLGSWNFAANFAGPFFAVYMLERLGLNMTVIMALFITGQLANVVFLRVWGHIADQRTHKSVLAVSGPLFLISVALWPFTALPDPHPLTMPLLVAIHVLAGISTAGVLLCGWNITLKLAPKKTSTAYLASNALVSGIAATIAPITAGTAADWLAHRGVHLSLLLPGGGAAGGSRMLDLRPLDFVFFFAIGAGIYALRRLRLVEERGKLEGRVMLSDVQAEIRAAVRSVSNIAGLRLLSSFPYGALRRRVPLEEDEPDEESEDS